MFDCTGEKIRSWGKILFLVGAISSVTAAILLWRTNTEYISTILPGFLVIILGILSSYFISLFICGFGTLIDETEKNRSVNEQILHAIEQLSASSAASEAVKSIDTAENRVPHHASSTTKICDGQWRCKNCGEYNPASELACKNCGKYR